MNGCITQGLFTYLKMYLFSLFPLFFNVYFISVFYTLENSLDFLSILMYTEVKVILIPGSNNL